MWEVGNVASRTHLEVVREVGIASIRNVLEELVTWHQERAWKFLGQGRCGDFMSTVFCPPKTCKTIRNKSSKSWHVRHLPREVALLLLLAGPRTALQCLLCPNTIYAFSGSFEPVELCTQTATSTYLYQACTLYIFIPCQLLSWFLHAFPIVSRLWKYCLSGSDLKLSTALLQQVLPTDLALAFHGTYDLGTWQGLARTQHIRHIDAPRNWQSGVKMLQNKEFLYHSWFSNLAHT